MERILLTAKLKLAPTPEQREWLWEMSRCATKLYNLALEQRRRHWLRYHRTRPGITYEYQNAELVELKEAFPEFKVLYSLVAQEVLRLVQKNFNSFFGRLGSQRANGREETARPPRFKSSRYFFTLCYVQSGFALEGNRLVISGGQGRRERIAIAGARHIPAEIHNLTLSYDRKSDAFYANVTHWVEVRPEQEERPLRVVAFDPGRRVFLTGADDSGLLVEIHSRTNAINAYFDKQTDRVKSLRDRCKKGSRRWRRLSAVLDELYRRRRAQAGQELHAISKLLAEGPWDVIVVGRPDKQGMVSKDPAKGKGNARINRAVQNDWPLVAFLGRLSYKCHLRDRYVKSADERYSTQRCSRCGHRQRLDLSVRIYRCPKCGLAMSRDENSAVNLLNKILAELARPPVEPEGFTARAVCRRTPWGRWHTETSAVHNMAAAPAG